MFVEAFLQGILQGITEFVPVSSSGHLLALQYILDKNSINKELITGLHLATGIAVLVYFRKRIWDLCKNSITKNTNNPKIESDKLLFRSLIISSSVTIILGILIKITKIEEFFNGLLSIGLSSIFFAILLHISVKKTQGNKKNITFKEALIIGASQILAALFPGASRFGITLTTCFLLSIDKQKSIEYVFFLSIPVIFLASIQEILFGGKIAINLEFIIAFVSSFISGLLAIFVVHQIVKNVVINVFTIYRIIFGIFCIYLHFIL